MRTIPYEDMFMSGNLYNQAIANFNRLERDRYTPNRVFQQSSYSWPGDFEGRTILALTLLSQATHRKSQYLQEIISRLPAHMNDKGYMGEVYPEDVFSEQQLSGNSWLLRGLIEYYKWTKDQSVYQHIENIVIHLLMPLKGNVRDYPSNPEERSLKGGEESGDIINQVRNWHLSTDIGCLFIMLDGATQAYELLGTNELKQLIEEMLAKFFSIPLLEIAAQTHATLSALRGALRYYGLTREPQLLKEIEKTYGMYVSQGMTENYANYNWFNNPSWTEPCAVIDSFIVAVELWRFTNQSKYLNDAHNIYYNALSWGQRYNGGFGCDCCSGTNDEFLTVRDRSFEAYWCCSMRGGEGLSKAIEYSSFYQEDVVYFGFFHNAVLRLKYEDQAVLVKQTTFFPYSGQVNLEIIDSENHHLEKEWMLFIPDWCPEASIKLKVNGQAVPYELEGSWLKVNMKLATGQSLSLEFEIPLRTEPAHNQHHFPKHVTYRHGYLMLGLDTRHGSYLEKMDELVVMQNGKYRTENGAILEPLYQSFVNLDERQKDAKYQILFQ